MKVTHLVSGLAGGGAEQLIAGLCKQSASDPDLQMEVVSMSYINEIGWKMQEFVVFPDDLSKNNKSRNKFISSLRAISFLIRRKPQLIHAHLFYACIAAGIVKLFNPRTKVVFTLHNSFQPFFFYRLLLFLTRPLRNADVSFPNLPRRWYQKKNLFIIPNGIDTSAFSAPNIPKNPVFTFLFAGRLQPQKSPLTLVEIAKKLATKFTFRIVVAGSGPLLKKLKDEVYRWGIGQYFEFAGYRQDVPPLLASSHCLLVPSNYEGMPLIIMEAAAAGLPVICTPEAANAFSITSDDASVCNKKHFPVAAVEVMTNYDFALEKVTRLQAKLFQLTTVHSYLEHKALYQKMSTYGSNDSSQVDPENIQNFR